MLVVEDEPPVREIAGLRLDPFRREVYRHGRYVALTSTRPRGSGRRPWIGQLV